MITRCRNFGIMLVILSLVISAGGCNKKAEEVPQEDVINVTVETVLQSDIVKYTGYSGRVKGTNEESVMPKLPRRVTAVYVTEGQSVSAGQLIATLDASKLDTAVQQAEAAVATAKAVQAGNVVQLQTALTNYNRQKELFDSGAASQQALETAKMQYDVLNTGAADAGVAQAQAMLSLAQQNLLDCRIVSPISGVIGRLDIAVGDMASPQVPAAVVNNTADLEVEVNVSEADVSAITAGAAVKVRIKAVSDEPITGTVKSVASVADAVKRTYPVIVVLPNNGASEVKSGMFAEVLLATQQRIGVTVVPMSAVLIKNGESTVYVAGSDKKAQSLVVETGLNDGTNIEITKGLKVGQKVVTKGNTLIDETSTLNFVGGGATQ